MNQYTNWVKREIRGGIEWRHKHDSSMLVSILRQSHPAGKAEYYIFHTHPAPGGNTVLQYPEGARFMKTAMQKAGMHLRHWNDPAKWQSDPDFGRMTNKP